MTNDKRITLRPAKTAVYLGCSTSTLWRWKQTLPDFPQPHKVPGQRITYWYKDELDAWAAKQRKAAEAAHRKEATEGLLDLAIHCSEAAGSGPDVHPFISAYLLVGEGIEALSIETGITESRLQCLWNSRAVATEEEMVEVFRVAAARVIYRERELAEQLAEASELRHREKFRRAVLSLDKAHELCFGRTLLDYLLEEGSDNGTA